MRKLYWLDDEAWARIEPHLPRGRRGATGSMIDGCCPGSGLKGGDGADVGARPLGPDDAAEMLTLATLTRPQPFRERTHELGGFIGVRRDGRLGAMAGQRLRLDGFTELSGVRTHPDFRGQTLADALSRRVVSNILAGGDRAFLHAYAGHEATARLYESLGFAVRAQVIYTVRAD